MPAITMSLARITARILPLAILASFTASAAQFVVNNETPLNVTTPPGFTYVVTDTSGALTVPTDGFLFCANIVDGGGDAATPVTVVPQHGGWMLPIAQDVRSVGYTAGALVVNRNIMSTLTCRSVGEQGEIASALSEGIFTDGLDPKVIEQYTKLVNWQTPAGFSWAVPNWASVPTDPCNPTPNQPAQVDEDVACAAVTGVRPGAANGVAVRSGTLLTGTDASNFFYVARVDARYGAQQTGQNGMRAPDLNAPNSGASVTLTLTDGYDRGALRCAADRAERHARPRSQRAEQRRFGDADADRRLRPRRARCRQRLSRRHRQVVRADRRADDAEPFDVRRRGLDRHAVRLAHHRNSAEPLPGRIAYVVLRCIHPPDRRRTAGYQRAGRCRVAAARAECHRRRRQPLPWRRRRVRLPAELVGLPLDERPVIAARVVSRRGMPRRQRMSVVLRGDARSVAFAA
jgi:hypothetical protein